MAKRQDLEEEYEKCNSLWHAWDPTAVTTADLACICVRCGSKREDTIDRFTGDLEHRKYTYSEGYANFLLKRKNSRIDYTMGRRRLEMMKRLRQANKLLATG